MDTEHATEIRGRFHRFHRFRAQPILVRAGLFLLGVAAWLMCNVLPAYLLCAMLLTPAGRAKPIVGHLLALVFCAFFCTLYIVLIHGTLRRLAGERTRQTYGTRLIVGSLVVALGGAVFATTFGVLERFAGGAMLGCLIFGFAGALLIRVGLLTRALRSALRASRRRRLRALMQEQAT